MPGKPQEDKTQACLSLIRSARVMILGTAAQGQAWTAPVYYLFDSGGFYFFSSPESRHIREGERHGCGAAIFHDSSRVEELKGVQMTGRIEACNDAGKAVVLAAAYAGKYGINVTARDALATLAKGFRAALYGFYPENIYFMDNSCGFGNREMISL